MAQIELITYQDQLVTPQYDALIHEKALLSNGMFYGGEVTIKDSTTLHIADGIGHIYGREFKILDQDIDINIGPSDDQGAVYVQIDLDNTNAPIDLLTYIGDASYTPVDNPQINETNSGVTEMVLATFTLDSLALQEVTNVVPEVGNGASNIAYGNETVASALDKLTYEEVDLKSLVTATSDSLQIAKVSRIGNIVIFDFQCNNITMPSGNQWQNISGLVLPEQFRPNMITNFVCLNNALNVDAARYMRIQPNGQVQFYKNGSDPKISPIAHIAFNKNN